jgi:hypothetical protein
MGPLSHTMFIRYFTSTVHNLFIDVVESLAGMESVFTFDTKIAGKMHKKI